MTRYELRRFLGLREYLPDDLYMQNSDSIFTELKDQFEKNSSDAEHRNRFLAFSWRFSRLDGVTINLDEAFWSEPSGALQRGRLRFYRALAENPEDPNRSLLDAAAGDFRVASEDSDSAAEALAGLVRLHGLVGDLRSAKKNLSRLIRSRCPGYRKAAAGAAMFLAESVAAGTERYKIRFLEKALRLLGRLNDLDSSLLRADIAERLGENTLCRQILNVWKNSGFPEAEIELLRLDTEDILRRGLSDDDELLIRRLAEYRNKRPSDPRVQVLQGDLAVRDPEKARIAWRSALVLDERHAEAWIRLGNLYREAIYHGDRELRDAWLQAAHDAVVRAVSLEPLNGVYRFMLGSIERENGRPGPAVASLLAGLALTPGDRDARRWLAMSWTDLGYSKELSPEGRKAAAGRSRSEWEQLYKDSQDTFDLLGLIKSTVIEGENLIDVPKMLKDLLNGWSEPDTGDLLDLAGDFIDASQRTEASIVLDIVEERGSDDPRIKAYRGEMSEHVQPQTAVNQYLEALNHPDVDPADFVQWSLAASEIAEGVSEESYTAHPDAVAILRMALGRMPNSRELLRSLSLALVRRGRAEEALSAYRTAVESFPEDLDLLEDTVWFSREIDRGDVAEDLLLKAIERTPENGRLWNQLGVHYMENGWNPQDESMSSQALKAAENAYRKAVELAPEQMIFVGNLGDALRQAGKWDEAEEYLKQADEEAFALNSLARLYDERSYSLEAGEASAADWDSAGEKYKEAAEKAVSNGDFLRDQAWWLFRERRLDEAVEVYRRAQIFAPGDEELLYGEFSCLRDLGQDESSLEILDKALEIHPDDIRMLVDRADVLGDLGRNDEALQVYEFVTHIDEAPAWIWMRYARFLDRRENTFLESSETPRLAMDSSPFYSTAYLLSGNPDSDIAPVPDLLLSAWHKAAEADPENREIRAELGTILMRRGKIDEARSVLRSSLIHGGAFEDAFALHNLGRLALIPPEPDLDQAVRDLERAAEIQPRSSPIWADLGLAYAVANRWQDCAAAFRHAVEIDGSNPTYSANLGMALFRTDRQGESTRHLRNALDMSGSDAEWENALGLAYLAAGETERALDSFRDACLSDPISTVYPANLAMAHESLRIPDGPIQ